eukprot:m51a1_g6725 hypothetical protein (572) ;mRNA; r:176392-178559
MAERVQRCFYEVLEVSRTASDDEIRRAYLRLAMVWHPDKNQDRLEEATERFKDLQRAYSVLSDKEQRAWYDEHRESILRGTDEDDEDGDDGVNLWPYFASSCFSGFTDGPQGFYTVYAKVFADLDALERDSDPYEDSEPEPEPEEESDDDGDCDKAAERYRAAAEKAKEKKAQPKKQQKKGRKKAAEAPKFGKSGSGYDECVGPFYAYWRDFCSKRSFAWHDEYKLSEAPDRRIKRAMEKENRKFRDKARREFNDRVRHLVEFAYRMDPRIRKHKAEMAKREHEMEARRKKEREEEATLMKEERERAMEEHQRMLEEELRAREGIEEDDGTFDPLAQLLKEMKLDEEMAEAVLESEPEEEEELFCVACNKRFKSDAQFANHESSKKHRMNVQRLRASVTLAGDDDDAAYADAAPAEEEAAPAGNEEPEPEACAPQAEAEETEEKGETSEEEEVEEKPKAPQKKAEEEAPSRAPQKKVNKKKLARMSKKQKQEAMEEASEEEEEPVAAVPTRADAKKDKRAEKRHAKEAKKQQKDLDPALRCFSCKKDFPSRNSLFKHIKESGHALPPAALH